MLSRPAVLITATCTYAAVFSVALHDFNRPEIRAACPAFDSFISILLLDILSQLLPVVWLTHMHMPLSIRRIGVNAGWVLLMAALLATTYICDQNIRNHRPCLDEIYTRHDAQISGTAGILLTVAFFVVLIQGIVAVITAIFVYHDARTLPICPCCCS